MSLSITLTINGTRQTVELEDLRVTLLDLLREPGPQRHQEGVRPGPVRCMHGPARRTPYQLLPGAGGQL